MSTFRQAKAYARRAAKLTGISAIVEETPNNFISISTEKHINTVLHANRDAVKMIITYKFEEIDTNPHTYGYNEFYKEHNVDTSQDVINYPYELIDLMDNL